MRSLIHAFTIHDSRNTQQCLRALEDFFIWFFRLNVEPVDISEGFEPGSLVLG
jgi:hypothetical protein